MMALPPFSDEIILLRGNNICRYDLVTSKLKILCRLDRTRYQGEGARKSELFSAMPFMIHRKSRSDHLLIADHRPVQLGL